MANAAISDAGHVVASGRDADPARTQYAALCYRVTKGRPEVLLITSRDTGRWVIPKGWPMPGKTGAEAAAQEAYEEAGAEGDCPDHCIGIYSYAKVIGPEIEHPCVVAVYPLKVRHLKSRFPERGQRVVKWFSPKKAAGKVNEPDLAQLLITFDPNEIDATAKD